MFLWDASNVEHIAKHGVLPEEAEQVTLNNPVDIERQLRSGESRIVQLGETDRNRILIVVLTLREGMIRVVTAFPANRRLRNFYLEEKGGSGNAEGPQNT